MLESGLLGGGGDKSSNMKRRSAAEPRQSAPAGGGERAAPSWKENGHSIETVIVLEQGKWINKYPSG